MADCDDWLQFVMEVDGKDGLDESPLKQEEKMLSPTEEEAHDVQR